MEKFDVPHIVLPDVITSHAKWRPTKIALVCGEKRLTWREFNQRINRVANGLIKSGLQRGDKVSALLTNSIEMAEIIFGTIKAGGVIVPLSSMVPGEGLAMMINDSDSRCLFVGPKLDGLLIPYRERLQNIPKENFFSVGFEAPGWNSYQGWLRDASDQEPMSPLTYEDDFNIIYSSGTTGVPKGIVHTHFARAHFALGLAADFRIDSSSVSILTTPMYANGTWMTFLPTILTGGTLVIMPQFDPKAFLELVQKERCTHTFMVPTQFIVIMSLPDLNQYDLSSMKIMISAAAPLRQDTKEQILRTFKCGLLELYGVTEGIGTTLKPEEMEGKIASVGTPIMGGDIRIIDDQGQELPRGEIGEIVGYGATLMRGYYKQPEKTAETIWRDERGRTYLKTGDVGKLDEDGYLYILDRKKDMIISGGINIFASDIEEVFAKHPEVMDVAVIGVPHEIWGETPVALVIRRKGGSVQEEALKEWANPKLAKYQRVSRVKFVDTFPRNALGKVLKRQLRESYRERAQ